MLFVVGGDVVRRCGLGDVVVVKVDVVKAVVVKVVVVEEVVVVVEMRLVQNNDSKRIILPQRSQPVTQIIPFRHRWGNLI